MSCKDKDGGTHHYACDCREEYLRELESSLAKAKAEATKLEAKWKGAERDLKQAREEIADLKKQLDYSEKMNGEAIYYREALEKISTYNLDEYKYPECKNCALEALSHYSGAKSIYRK